MKADYKVKTPITIPAQPPRRPTDLTRWHLIGHAYSKPDGSILVCLDSVPMNGGQIHLFPVDKSDGTGWPD